jgi:hypothetical protein
LTGFTPYLENRLNADTIFGGGVIRAGPIPTAVQLATVAADNFSAGSVPSRILSRLAFWRRKR